MKKVFEFRWSVQSLLVLILLTFIACSTVPLTGRRQLSLVPESEMMALSFTEYDKFIKSNKLSADKNNAAMVKRVGERIARAVEGYMASAGLSKNLDGYKWEFNLVENPTVNAWCMSGGKVVVYSGLLPITQNEAGLATVMGHEIAHAVARHGSERMSVTRCCFNLVVLPFPQHWRRNQIKHDLSRLQPMAPVHRLV